MKSNKTKQPWKVQSERVYDEFRIFRIRNSTRVNPRTGQAIQFFLMDGLDWVNVIALTDDQQVILVKQYRHGSESFTLEIPGGCVEKDEDPRDSAIRELMEETGYKCDRISKLGAVHANPAMQSMRCHIFVAHGCKKTAAPSLDPGEDIKVEVIPLVKVNEMLQSGEISHALVVAAFGLYFL